MPECIPSLDDRQCWQLLRSFTCTTQQVPTTPNIARLTMLSHITSVCMGLNLFNIYQFHTKRCKCRQSDNILIERMQLNSPNSDCELLNMVMTEAYFPDTS